MTLPITRRPSRWSRNVPMTAHVVRHATNTIHVGRRDPGVPRAVHAVRVRVRELDAEAPPREATTRATDLGHGRQQAGPRTTHALTRAHVQRHAFTRATGTQHCRGRARSVTLVTVQDDGVHLSGAPVSPSATHFIACTARCSTVTTCCSTVARALSRRTVASRCTVLQHVSSRCNTFRPVAIRYAALAPGVFRRRGAPQRHDVVGDPASTERGRWHAVPVGVLVVRVRARMRAARVCARTCVCRLNVCLCVCAAVRARAAAHACACVRMCACVCL